MYYCDFSFPTGGQCLCIWWHRLLLGNDPHWRQWHSLNLRPSPSGTSAATALTALNALTALTALTAAAIALTAALAPAATIALTAALA